MKSRLILWTGPKHSGKTSSAARLAQKAKSSGFSVAGLLAPAIYTDGRLTGFEALDLKTNERVPLAERKRNPTAPATGEFIFSKDGLEFGKNALSIESVESTDLIIVDEFGPLELNGSGWREDVDSILSTLNAVLLLVVREQITEKVKKLYSSVTPIQLEAAESSSVPKVIEILRNSR
jgi:nucleoside-triphosphatase THEP1